MSAYPTTLRIMTLILRVPAWATVAYVLQVWADFQECSAANEGRSSAQVSQHTLNLAFGGLMRASHFGVTVTMMDGTQGVVSPRVVLNVSDQPEERDILCLKRHGTAFSYTPCMAPLSSYRRRSDVPHKKRNVLKIVSKQLKGARLRGTHGTGLIIDAMEALYSIHCIVPALAAWAGLGSGCLLLCQMFGFDRLNVRPSLQLTPIRVFFIIMYCLVFLSVVCAWATLNMVACV